MIRRLFAFGFLAITSLQCAKSLGLFTLVQTKFDVPKTLTRGNLPAPGHNGLDENDPYRRVFINTTGYQYSMAADTIQGYTVIPVYVVPVGSTVDPDWKARFQTLLEMTQRFFGEEMQRNGFGYKTFKMELEASGRPVVHFLEGQDPVEVFAPDIVTKEHRVLAVVGPGRGWGGGGFAPVEGGWTPRGGIANVTDEGINGDPVRRDFDYGRDMTEQKQIFCDKTVPHEPETINDSYWYNQTRQKIAAARVGGFMHELGHAFRGQHYVRSSDFLSTGFYNINAYFAPECGGVAPVVAWDQALILNNSAFLNNELQYTDNTTPSVQAFNVGPIRAGKDAVIDYTVSDETQLGLIAFQVLEVAINDRLQVTEWRGGGTFKSVDLSTFGKNHHGQVTFNPSLYLSLQENDYVMISYMLFDKASNPIIRGDIFKVVAATSGGAESPTLGDFSIVGVTGGTDLTRDFTLNDGLIPDIHFQPATNATHYAAEIKDSLGEVICRSYHSTSSPITLSRGAFDVAGTCNLGYKRSYSVFVTAYSGASAVKTATNTGVTFQVGSPKPGAEIAKGQQTTQSSTGFGGYAWKAVDGVTDGLWNSGSTTHTNNDFQPWWEVDLGFSFDISQIKLFNRTDCCADRLKNFYIMISDNPFPSGTLDTDLPGVTYIHEAGQVGTSATYTTTAKGRYVRIQLSDTNHLSLAEVQILAGGSAPPVLYQLSVSKTGSGTVTSSGGEISCGATCTSEFTSGSQVTLSATPAADYVFTGWSGSCNSVGTVLIDSNKSCVANFTSSSTCPLTGKAKVGGYCWYLGEKSKSCNQTCSTKALSCVAAGLTYANSTKAICQTVGTSVNGVNVVGTKYTSPIGCSFNGSKWRQATSATCTGVSKTNSPACACQ